MTSVHRSFSGPNLERLPSTDFPVHTPFSNFCLQNSLYTLLSQTSVYRTRCTHYFCKLLSTPKKRLSLTDLVNNSRHYNFNQIIPVRTFRPVARNSPGQFLTAFGSTHFQPLVEPGCHLISIHHLRQKSLDPSKISPANDE